MKMKLSEQLWSFKAVRDEQWLPAQVPGCVHTDLLREQKIKDPFYGTNEHDLQWIDKIDWEYKTTFQATEDILKQQVQELLFHGLDTYANVYLNGELILQADNMFRAWKVDVTGKLVAGNNVLHIVFRSPIQEDLPKLKALGYQLPATNDQSELGGLGGDRVSIFARKAPYHYGWDWGPRFVTSGVWRDIELIGWSGVNIIDVYLEQTHISAEAAKLNAKVKVEAKVAGKLELLVGTEDVQWQLDAEVEAGMHELELPIYILEPKLWWCRGLGEANLYTFQTTAALTSKQQLYSAQATTRTGLRQIKLVRDRDAQGTGATFHFELNGVPVFAKGANHIPNDSFLTEITDARYRAEIVAAVEANMNMLRIWGGGIYEPDIFYELCDEYGIMVWQDFMFACSMYPGDEAFLESVKQEAIENVVRLRNHPSIVLWCGNNEIDSAWAQYDENGGWGWKKEFTTEQRNKIWKDYEKIFHQLLPEVVSQLHNTVDYWPSSPLVSLSNSIEQHASPNTNEGDIHYWGVWHNVEPFENYQIKLGRFMSEYGFQSFPEYRTIRSFAEEDELAIDSKVMKAHQKNGDGNRLIKEYMDIYMKSPKDFKSFLYLSQVLQADAMKMAIEAHRRKMPYCMGSLYWQMNDCWPVASWSGIDYYGRWKALHYYAKRSFSPILVSAQENEDMLDIYIVSDELQAFKGKLVTALYTTAGVLISKEEQEQTTPINTSNVVKSVHIPDLLGSYRKEEVVFTATWINEQEGQQVNYEHYFVKNQELQLKQPTITMKVEHNNNETYVTLSTDVLAKQVAIITEEEGIWSDNYFDLIPGKPKTISFYKFADERGYVGALASKVQIQSMYDHIIQD